MIPTYKLPGFVRRKCLITVFSKLSLACITQPKKEILARLWIMNKKQILPNEASGMLCSRSYFNSIIGQHKRIITAILWLAFAKCLGFLRMNFTPRRKFNQQLCSLMFLCKGFFDYLANFWLFCKFYSSDKWTKARGCHLHTDIASKPLATKSSLLV